MKCLFHSKPMLVSLIAASSVLSACGDGSALSSGAGAGDDTLDEQIAASITLLEPFIGVFDLQDDWMGTAGDEAFLAIRLTDNEGISEAVLIDFDDVDNCIPSRQSTGEVTKDSFSDRIFLDDILQFSQAELALDGDNLTIDAADFFDIDNDGDTDEIVTTSAVRIAVMENDLGDPC